MSVALTMVAIDGRGAPGGPRGLRDVRASVGGGRPSVDFSAVVVAQRIERVFDTLSSVSGNPLTGPPLADAAGRARPVGLADAAGRARPVDLAGSVGLAGSSGRPGPLGCPGPLGRAGTVGLAGSVGLTDAAGRARPVSLAGQHLLPVLAPLAPLFPDGGLRRGTTVGITAETGEGTTLALSAVAAATQAGSWCAAVRWPTLGLVAASGLGVALERFALVPHPGEQWPAVVAALIDAVDLLLFRSPRGVRSSEARRLVARARERGVVLVVAGAVGAWPGIDLTLSVAGTGEWRGLGEGYGYLHSRAAEVTSVGRGAASRPRRIRLWLPGSGGTLQERQQAAEPGATSISATAAG